MLLYYPQYVPPFAQPERVGIVTGIVHQGVELHHDTALTSSHKKLDTGLKVVYTYNHNTI